MDSKDQRTNTGKASEQQRLPEEAESKEQKKQKKIEYTGSRWTGLVLLVLTTLVSVFLYTKGHLAGGLPNISGFINTISSSLFGQETETFEK